MKPNNPPAFPSLTAPIVYGAWGMALRDYFAASVVSAVILHTQKALDNEGEVMFFGDEDDEESHSDIIADYSYNLADAMLRARASIQPQAAPPSEPVDIEVDVLKIFSNAAGGLVSGKSLAGYFRKDGKSSTAMAALKALISKGQVVAIRHIGSGLLTYATAESASRLMSGDWRKA